MPRASKPNNQTKATSQEKTKQEIRDANIKKAYCEIQLAHGAGFESIYLPTKATLDKFVINVTKRNLEAYPLALTDINGDFFIIRSFLFSKIVINES